MSSAKIFTQRLKINNQVNYYCSFSTHYLVSCNIHQAERMRAPDKLDSFRVQVSAFFCVQSPWASDGGGRPQGLTLCSLGGHWDSGLRKQLHTRGSRLDVHTELFVYVGASRRSCQFLFTWKPFWGPKKNPLK